MSLHYFLDCLVHLQWGYCLAIHFLLCNCKRCKKKTGQIPLKNRNLVFLSLFIPSRWSWISWETFLNNSILKLLLWRPQPTITIKKFKIFLSLFNLAATFILVQKKVYKEEEENSSNNPSIDSQRKNSAKKHENEKHSSRRQNINTDMYIITQSTVLFLC